MKSCLCCLCLALALPATTLAAEGPSLPGVDTLRLLREARIAGMKGDTAREVETLRAAAEAHPEEIAPVYALLEFHRRQPLPDDEWKSLQKSFVERLEDPERRVPVGVLDRIARDPGVEESILRLMAEQIGRWVELQEMPEIELLQLLVALQDRLELSEEALATRKELYRRQPSEALEWQIYQSYVNLERWPEAAALMESMLEKKDGRADLRRIYIRLLSKAGRLADLRAQIDFLLGESDPQEATEDNAFYISLDGLAQGNRRSILWTTAWDLRDGGYDTEAEALLRRLLELDPEHQGARNAVLHLYGTEEERRALAAAEAEHWRDETDPRKLFDEGTERLMAGDAEGAVDLLKRAAPGLPELEAAWYNLGMAAYRMKDWETTESALARAAELNPERAEAFFFRGIALVQLDRCQDTLAPLLRAVELDPGRNLAHYHLARCYRALGNAEAAARHQRLYDANP